MPSAKSPAPSLLIVDDDPSHLAMLSTMTGGWGFSVHTADDGSKAVDMVRERPFDVVLMDVRMAVMDGIRALKEIRAYNPAIGVIIMTAYTSVESAVEALKSGAYDYLTKPLDFDVLRHTLERAVEHTRLKRENTQLKEQLATAPGFEGIIGQSRPMRDLLEMAAVVADSEATVLITGESGTGKELIARAIHQASPRASGPLVTVNASALPENLLESELFGHEKGAFTGAEKRREGRFMQADGGTLFLDEIGEMPLAMQAKLLRAIQEGEIQRVGSDAPVTVDVRILTATHRDLPKLVEERAFREDLYYRLNVVNLHVPPLRERREDIPLLAQHFLERFAAKNRKTLRGFTPGAMDALVKYDWPGNIRELENSVERAVILTPGDWIGERELPLAVTRGRDLGEVNGGSMELAGQPLDEIEREAILATLDKTEGNKSEAARLLGITRATLHKKLKRYGVD